jgi:F-type H+-transporting ATPase subunit epsilon
VAADKLKVAVISPDRTVYEGEGDQVVAPAWDGEIGILRGHAPTLVLLGSGVVRVTNAGQDHRFRIEGGVMQVVDNVVTVLSEHAEPS